MAKNTNAHKYTVQEIINLIYDETAKSLSLSDTISNSLVPSQYDTIVINYTNSTKTTVSNYIFKLGSTVVSTITPSVGTTSKTYTRT